MHQPQVELTSNVLDASLAGLTLDESIAWARDDAKLRSAAPALYPIVPHVIREAGNHKKSAAVCLECGDVYERLTWCGVPLCIPCWRKKAGHDFLEVAATIQVAEKRRYENGKSPGIRHVTLTIRSGHDLKERSRFLLDSWERLRHTAFWRTYVDGENSKIEATYDPGEGWHVHLHFLTEGGFMPKSDRFRDPRWSSEKWHGRRDNWTLVDMWARATRGEGYIVDISQVDVMHDPLGAARELAKYVAKPFLDVDTDKERTPLWAWDEDVRNELASYLVGGQRTRWYCPIHQARTRARCEEIIRTSAHPRSERRACTGAYRKERVGLRHLRWSGHLRVIHNELMASWAKEIPEDACRKCGKGHYVSVYAAYKIATFYQEVGGPVLDGILDLMKAYISASQAWTNAVKTGQNPRWEGPGGKSGPPPRSRRLLEVLERPRPLSEATPEVEQLVRTMTGLSDMATSSDTADRSVWRVWDARLREENWVVAKRLHATLEEVPDLGGEDREFYLRYILTGVRDVALLRCDDRAVQAAHAYARARALGHATLYVCHRCGTVQEADAEPATCDQELGGCGRPTSPEDPEATSLLRVIVDDVRVLDERPAQDPVILEAVRLGSDILHVHRDVPLGYLLAQVAHETSQKIGRPLTEAERLDTRSRLERIMASRAVLQ